MTMSSDLRLVQSGDDQPARPATRVPTGGYYQPDRLASDLEDVHVDPDEPLTDGGRVLRRLLASGGVILFVACINFFVLARYGLELPPYLLLTTFAVIATAGILACFAESDAQAESNQLAKKPDARDEGCAVGLCPGPRPPRFLSK